jgi:hypothetical protein
MGSPTIFKGSRTKLLTANGLETKDNQFIDYDGDLELCRQSLSSFTDGSYSAATRPTGSFTAGAAGLVTSSATPFMGKKFAVTLTKTGACQGAASIQEYDLPEGLRAKVLCLKVDYRVASGTFNAGSTSSDSDLIFYIEEYNGTSWQKKEPSTFKLFSNSSTIADQYSGYFQTNADTTKIRIIAYVATTGNNNFSLVCSFSLSATKYVYGTPITDWVEYTPQLLGSVTNPTIGPDGFVSGRWRRVGDSVEIHATASRGISGGSNGSGEYYITLPQGMVADLTKLSGSDNVGTGYVLDGLVLAYTGVAIIASDGFRLSVVIDQTGNLISNNIPSAGWWTSTGLNFFTVKATLPIQGWSSSVKMSDGYDGREIVFESTSSLSSIAANTTLTVPLTPVIDTVSGLSGGNSYVVQASGYYEIDGCFSATTSSAATSDRDMQITVNNTLVARSVASFTYVGTHSVNKKIYLKAGDVVRWQISNGVQAINLIYNLNVGLKRISSPQTIAMGEVVAARYSTASGQSIPNNTGTIINFNTKEYDTHNAVTTGSNWKFTAPVAGEYHVSSHVLYDAFAAAGVGAMSIRVYKNDSPHTDLGRTVFNAEGNATNKPAFGSTDVQLNAGDTINIVVFNGSGAARNLFSNAQFVWVAIHKIS